jgi:hypothetical protein
MRVPHALKGHGFSHAKIASKSMRALQAAEKPYWAVGQGFIPGVRSAESARALAPEVCLSGNSPAVPSFSIACLAPAPFSRHTSRIRPCLSAASLAALILLAGCKPVGPNYTRPTYTAPPTYKETGASIVVTPPPPNPPEAPGSPPTPPTECSRGNGGRFIRIRSSTSLRSASQPITRACGRRWRPISPRRTR